MVPAFPPPVHPVRNPGTRPCRSLLSMNRTLLFAAPALIIVLHFFVCLPDQTCGRCRADQIRTVLPRDTKEPRLTLDKKPEYDTISLDIILKFPDLIFCQIDFQLLHSGAPTLQHRYASHRR